MVLRMLQIMIFVQILTSLTDWAQCVLLKKKLRSLASTLYEWETSSRCRDDFVAVTEDIDVAMKLAEAVIAYADSLCVKIELKDMNLEN